MAWTGRFDDFSNYSSTSCKPTQRNTSSGRGSVTPKGTLVKISEITQDISSVNLIGIILSKDGPKSIISQKGSERFLIAFTLRDSPDDFINCTCWGNQDFINSLSVTVNIGDIVEVKNAQIQTKSTNPADDRYKPWTPSVFQLNLSENQSSVETYSGWDLSTYSSLRHIPTKPSNDFYTLEDININGTSLQREHVNILVAVKQIWPVRNISTKTGKQTKKCDVVLCDETCNSFILTLWDSMTDSVQSWVPRQTILFGADVKIVYNEYKSCMSASADSKTIFTVDPDTPEGHILYQFMRSQSEFGSSFLADTDSNEQDPELSSIRDVYTVDQVKQWKTERCDERSVQYGIMFIYPTVFNIDADVFKTICSKCRREVRAEAGYICTNDQCPGEDNPSTDFSGQALEYNIIMSVSDQCGTLDFCYLQGVAAEEAIKYKVNDFHSLDIKKKTEIKWTYLLERCKIIIKMKKISTDFSTKASFKILSLSRADPVEMMNAIGPCF